MTPPELCSAPYCRRRLDKGGLNRVELVARRPQLQEKVLLVFCSPWCVSKWFTHPQSEATGSATLNLADCADRTGFFIKALYDLFPDGRES